MAVGKESLERHPEAVSVFHFAAGGVAYCGVNVKARYKVKWVADRRKHPIYGIPFHSSLRAKQSDATETTSDPLCGRHHR